MFWFQSRTKHRRIFFLVYFSSFNASFLYCWFCGSYGSRSVLSTIQQRIGFKAPDLIKPVCTHTTNIHLVAGLLSAQHSGSRRLTFPPHPISSYPSLKCCPLDTAEDSEQEELCLSGSFWGHGLWPRAAKWRMLNTGPWQVCRCHGIPCICTWALQQCLALLP